MKILRLFCFKHTILLLVFRGLLKVRDRFHQLCSPVLCCLERQTSKVYITEAGHKWMYGQSRRLWRTWAAVAINNKISPRCVVYGGGRERPPELSSPCIPAGQFWSWLPRKEERKALELGLGEMVRCEHDTSRGYARCHVWTVTVPLQWLSSVPGVVIFFILLVFSPYVNPLSPKLHFIHPRMCTALGISFSSSPFHVASPLPY